MDASSPFAIYVKHWHPRRRGGAQQSLRKTEHGASEQVIPGARGSRLPTRPRAQWRRGPSRRLIRRRGKAGAFPWVSRRRPRDSVARYRWRACDRWRCRAVPITLQALERREPAHEPERGLLAMGTSPRAARHGAAQLCLGSASSRRAGPNSPSPPSTVPRRIRPLSPPTSPHEPSFELPTRSRRDTKSTCFEVGASFSSRGDRRLSPPSGHGRASRLLVVRRARSSWRSSSSLEPKAQSASTTGALRVRWRALALSSPSRGESASRANGSRGEHRERGSEPRRMQSK
jgi:hypothetical protein